MASGTIANTKPVLTRSVTLTTNNEGFASVSNLSPEDVVIFFIYDTSNHFFMLRSGGAGTTYRVLVKDNNGSSAITETTITATIVYAYI